MRGSGDAVRFGAEGGSSMKRAYLVFVLFVLSCSTTHQHFVVRPGPAGSIVGVVTESEGVPIPGVTVTLTSSAFPKRTAITDANGNYAIVGLAPGAYTLTVRLEGFNTISSPITLTADQGIALETALTMSSVSESITVTASAPGAPGWLPEQPLRRARNVRTAPSVVSMPMRQFDDSSYAAIQEKGFIDTRDEATTTFAIDVDRASYANLRRYLRSGMVPPPNAVRIEEMVNYFTYSYPQPDDGQPFSVTTEVAGCPWNARNRLVRVGIQGRNVEEWRMAPNNLVFLIDVSGSMDDANKLSLLRNALPILVDGLRAEDRVAIVVYAGAAGLVLPSTSGADKPAILEALRSLRAGGSTAGGAGIELAYEIAQQNFLPHGNNRVILATDGDFNVGVSSMEGLQKLIEEKRRSGIFLSVVGVGQHDLQDGLMEMLADKGNGNYAYLDSMQEAEKVFRHELTGTLVAIAKDVKVQIEFDASAVESYRQIGYENRALQNKDFDDDTKDAGELGAGHSVTALFEVVPKRNTRAKIATVRLRYKSPNDEQSHAPLVAEVIDEGKSAYDASPDLQFAAAVAEMGMLLRDSSHKGDATWDDVFHLARVSRGADLDGARTEFLALAETAQGLK
jgi:Ca-activated chloride channel family protein